MEGASLAGLVATMCFAGRRVGASAPDLVGLGVGVEESHLRTCFLEEGVILHVGGVQLRRAWAQWTHACILYKPLGQMHWRNLSHIIESVSGPCGRAKTISGSFMKSSSRHASWWSSVRTGG